MLITTNSATAEIAHLLLKFVKNYLPEDCFNGLMFIFTET